MKNLMVMPKQFFFDNNGDPLAFGKVYTYKAGTLINQETYTTQSGDVPNANPVILNSEGYADIFLEGDYDFVVTDAADATIWTAGPISSNTSDEWTYCTEASYVGPTSFKMLGNLTVSFDPGRRVRIDNNVPTYSYSTVASSIYAAGETTVVVVDSLVGVGIKEACASIVGSNSIELNKVYAENGTIILDGGTNGTDATLTGDVTGNVTGNLTGDVEGNVVGNVTGNADSADTSTTTNGINEQGLSAGVLKVKVVDIGDWNMDTTVSVIVSHGLILANIRSIDVVVRNDADNLYYSLLKAGSATTVVAGGVDFVGSSTLNLSRVTGGFFDGANFDSTSFNRGWITIWYVG